MSKTNTPPPHVNLALPMAELASRLLKDATFGNSDDRVIVKAVLRAIDGEIAQAHSGSTPPPQTHVAGIKQLEWIPYHSDGATVYEGQNQKRRFVASARFPWGGTVCVMEKDGWFTLDGSCFGAFVDEQAAKDAAQAEYERWILAALATTEGAP